MTTPTKLLTYEEWQKLPETRQRYEIVDGVMFMPPGPNVDHQWLMLDVYSRISNHVRASGIGVVLAAPLDVLIQREPLRVRQPDILYLNSQRTGIRRRTDVIGMQFLESAPDFVVEVLSPSNSRREMEGRLRDYQQIGVYQCWLFSPQAETAEIIDLKSNQPRSMAIFGTQDTLRSDLLPSFELNLCDIFN